MNEMIPRKSLCRILFLVAAIASGGCSQVGDYYRVDRLIDHRGTTGLSHCVSAPGKDTQGMEKRTPDCDSAIPPVNLDNFAFPGSQKPAYIEAVACVPKSQSERSFRSGSVSLMSDVLSASKLKFGDARTAWRSPPLKKLTTKDGDSLASSIEASVDRIVASINQAELELGAAKLDPGAGWIELVNTPMMLSLVSIESDLMDGRINSAIDILSASIESNKKRRQSAEKNKQELEAKKKPLSDGDKKALDETLAVITDTAESITSNGVVESELRAATMVLRDARAAVGAIRSVLEDRLGYCDNLRNRLQSVLLSRSDALCESHKGDIHAAASGFNFGLGLATTLLSGAGAIASGQAAQRTYAAFASSTNATRSILNEQVYQQQVAGAITSAVDSARRRKSDEIAGQRLVPVSRYSVDEAIRDAQEYHFQCSFYAGLTELKNAISERNAKEPQRITERIRELDTKISEIMKEGSNATYVSELKAERHRLLLRKVNY
jgi:hypothetical protein